MPSGNSKMDDVQWADVNLVSPNNPVWRTLFSAAGTLQNDAAEGTYILGTATGTAGVGMFASGTDTASVPQLLTPFPFTATDYAVAGKTTKLRLLVLMAPNEVTPQQTFKFKLGSILTGGGADLINFQFFGEIAAALTEVVKPEGAAVTRKSGAEVTAPATQNLGLAVTTTGGALTNNSKVHMAVHVQMCHV